jgi:hypothetical protein
VIPFAVGFIVLNFFAQHIGMFVYRPFHHGPMPSVDGGWGAIYFFLGLFVIIVGLGIIAAIVAKLK